MFKINIQPASELLIGVTEHESHGFISIRVIREIRVQNKTGQKKLLVYDPAMHDYSREAPQWRELRPAHFVLCSAAEAEQWLPR